MVRTIFEYITIVLLICAIILVMVGWDQVNLKKREKTTAPVLKKIRQPAKEVRIVAIRENSNRIKIEEKIFPKSVQKVNFKPRQIRVKKSKTVTRIKPKKKRLVSKKYQSKRIILPPKRMRSQTFIADKKLVRSGQRLINTKNTVPIVLASYDQIGFNDYLKKMHALGGRLYIGDAIAQKVLAEVMIYQKDGTYTFVGLSMKNSRNLDHMALFRPREITGEVLVDQTLASARREFSGTDLRCVIMLPLEKEAAFLGALKQYLDINGYHISQFEIFWGHYYDTGRHFGLQVDKGRMHNSAKEMIMKMRLIM